MTAQLRALAQAWLTARKAAQAHRDNTVRVMDETKDRGNYQSLWDETRKAERAAFKAERAMHEQIAAELEAP